MCLHVVSIDGAIVLLIELPFLFACCCNCAKRFQNTAFFQFFNRTLVRGILYISYVKCSPVHCILYSECIPSLSILCFLGATWCILSGVLLVLSGVVYIVAHAKGVTGAPEKVNTAGTGMAGTFGTRQTSYSYCAN